MRGRSKPFRDSDTKQAQCYRCGQWFSPGKQHVVVGAPCRDCRELLRAEGDLTVWSTRSTNPGHVRSAA